ncbi:uncharacterized protein LOC125194761 [Salvia hispanica]|uniref:uncharacterized protein LOC125194761 n=1 Tax=Salvia hispanica TaxID=49212 RepID=UPI002009CF9F|nr:uncharacterized protein LOC125194761 [Salvia hispanica]
MYGDTMHPSIYPSETHSPSLLNIAPRHLRLTCIFRNICKAEYRAISDHLVPLRWCSHTVTFPAQHDRGILMPGRWPPSTVTFSAVRSRSEKFLLSPPHSIVTNEKENRKELCASCLLLTVDQPPSGAAAAASSSGVSFSPSGSAAIIDHRCSAPPQPNFRKIYKGLEIIESVTYLGCWAVLVSMGCLSPFAGIRQIHTQRDKFPNWLIH